MDKKQSSHKVRTFFKKNVYYIIMAVCLLAIAAMITVSVLINNGTIGGINPDDTPAITDPDDDLNNGTVPNPDDGNGNNNNNNDNTGNVTPEPEQPTAIVLASPVNSANVLLNYSMDQLVWNSTLKHYAVHNGMDFGGNDGDEVYSAYDGVVTEITYDILNGHTVTIKHSDTLSTKYSSLNEPVVSVGQSVTKGGVIGTMGTTATSEYSMGAHLHFMVLENGQEVDPTLFLADSEDK